MPTFDTSAEAASVQIEIYRGMDPADRLRVGLELTRLSRALLEEGIRARHPEYDAEQVRLAAIRVWLTPELFRQAYPWAPEISP